ncbi:probable G-protein coupled receptor 139 [Haliotis asinina]|uniref:probable G-protein coupled receptor 139 n=1 Tax=Haliotis asinina TaxID=109174 RepID=UPI0035321667
MKLPIWLNNSSSSMEVNTSIDSNSSDWETIDDIAFHIETYYLWVILALGFPGNCSTVVTIIKMSPARSLTVYIALLAIVDNLAILNKLLIFVLTDNGVPIGQFGCKFLAFCGNFLITFANWLLVAMSVERFVAVWYPFKIGQIWTFKKSLVVVIGITIPLLGLFLHLFWTVHYVNMETYILCVAHEDHLDFFVNAWFWINITVYALLPCLLLLVFNALIIAGIVKSSKVHIYLNRNGSVKNGAVVTTERQRQITKMLVSSAIALVILTFPRCVMLLMSPHLNYPTKSMNGAVIYLVDTIAYVFCDSTHAINFYLYSFSARRFRRQFLDLVACRKRKMAPVSTQYITLSSRPSMRFNMALFRESVNRPPVRHTTSNDM